MMLLKHITSYTFIKGSQECKYNCKSSFSGSEKELTKTKLGKFEFEKKIPAELPSNICNETKDIKCFPKPIRTI